MSKETQIPEEGGTKEVSITFRANKWVAHHLELIAKHERRSKSDLIHIALEDWINAYMTPGLIDGMRKAIDADRLKLSKEAAEDLKAKNKR